MTGPITCHHGIESPVMAEPISQPVFFVADENPSAVEALISDLKRRFHADYRVVGETSAAALERLDALQVRAASAVGEGSVAIPQVHQHLQRIASRAAC